MPRASSSIRSRVSVIALALLAGSCGSDTKGAAPEVTSIDKTKAMSSLPVADMQTLCNDFNTYLVRQTAQDLAQRTCRPHS